MIQNRVEFTKEVHYFLPTFAIVQIPVKVGLLSLHRCFSVGLLKIAEK